MLKFEARKLMAKKVLSLIQRDRVTSNPLIANNHNSNQAQDVVTPSIRLKSEPIAIFIESDFIDKKPKVPQAQGGSNPSTPSPRVVPLGSNKRKDTGRSQSAQPSISRVSKLSNVKQVKNALMSVCLAGEPQNKSRAEAIEAIDDALANGVFSRLDSDRISYSVYQFIILLAKSISLSFRGVYCSIPQLSKLRFLVFFLFA